MKRPSQCWTGRYSLWTTGATLYPDGSRRYTAHRAAVSAPGCSLRRWNQICTINPNTWDCMMLAVLREFCSCKLCVSDQGTTRMPDNHTLYQLTRFRCLNSTTENKWKATVKPVKGLQKEIGKVIKLFKVIDGKKTKSYGFVALWSHDL